MKTPSSTVLVSVLLPSYNYGRYIGATIRSVLAQTCTDFELIISDDASTDDSRTIIRSFTDPRIRYLEQPVNLGNIEHFARMYAECRGTFVAYIDSDDLWEPAKLERQLAAFASDPALSLAATHIKTVDAEGRPPAGEDPVTGWFNTPFDPNDWSCWIHQNRICMSSILARKSAHDAIGVRSEGLTVVADWEIWLRFLAQGLRLAVVPEPLTVYRVHQQGLWGQRGQEALRQHVYISQAVLQPALHRAGRSDLIQENFAQFISRSDFQALPATERTAMLALLANPAPHHTRYPLFQAALTNPPHPEAIATALDWTTGLLAKNFAWQKELVSSLQHTSDHSRRLEQGLTAYKKQNEEILDWTTQQQNAETWLNNQRVQLEQGVDSYRRLNEEQSHWISQLQQARDALQEQLHTSEATRAALAQESARQGEKITELAAALDWQFLQAREEKKRADALALQLQQQQAWQHELEAQPWYQSAAAQAATLAWESAQNLSPSTEDCRHHFELVCDEPTSQLRIFKGWAFARDGSGSGVRAHYIRPGAQGIVPAEPVTRPDVVAAFPGETDATDCGFILRIPVHPGDNIIVIEVQSGHGWLPFYKDVVRGLPSVLPGLRPTGGLPLVSVIIPCFNYGQYVHEAVESALAQTWSHLEVIVVDDGSTDTATARALAQLDHPRVRLIRTENRKLPAARNRGIHEGRGEYLCCLDADDKLAPTYIEKCLILLLATGCDICGSWQQNFGLDAGGHKPGEFTVENLWWSNQMLNAALFSRALWTAVGGYDESFTLGYEDWDFWIRCAKQGARASVVPEPLFFYRKHGPSMINATQARHEEILGRLRATHYQTAPTLRLRTAGPVEPGALWTALQPDPPLLAIPDRPPHLLLALPYMVLGGVDTLLSQICSQLTKAGLGLTIITTETPAPAQGDNTSLFEQATRDIFHLPRLLPPEQWTDCLLHLVGSRQVSHLWRVGSSWTYDNLPRLHDEFPALRVVDLIFNTVGHTANNRRFAHHLDLTITENTEVRDWLMDRGEWPDRVRVIPNGVDLDRYQPRPATAARTVLPPAMRDKFVVGFFGRFSHEKAPDAFVHLAAIFRDRPHYQFLLAGTGPLEPGIRALAAELGVTDTLHWPGIVESAAWLPSCDVVVVPSRMDGRPNIVLEALACGIPVVATRVGGLPELVTEGYTGYLIDPIDLSALETALVTLHDAADRRLAMSIAARTSSLEKFDIKHSINDYLELFRAHAPGPETGRLPVNS